MRHFTCDVCGRSLAADDTASRYVVRVEGYPATEITEPFDDGLDSDHVADMADLLDETDSDGPAVPMRGVMATFDMCPNCYRRFQADPLGRDRRRVRFSPN